MGDSGDLGKTSIGLDANVAGLLAYALGLVSGIVLFVIEKENKFVRFHALQSILVSGALFVASVILVWIPVLGWLLLMLLQLAALAAWIICMVKAFQKEAFRLPVVGDIAAKQVGL